MHANWIARQYGTVPLVLAKIFQVLAGRARPAVS